MSALFGEILREKTEVEHHFRKFTKSLQTELAFIEKRVRADAEKHASIYLCCLNLFAKIGLASASVESQQKEFNPLFFEAFQMMSPQQRQTYYLQLLRFINTLVDTYEANLDVSKKGLGEGYLKLLRQSLKLKMEDSLLDENINERMESLAQSTFYVKTVMDGESNDKVLRFDRSLLVFIQRVDKKELTLRVDGRNYLMLQCEESQLSLELRSVFCGVGPQHIKLSLQSDYDKRWIVPYLKQVNKIGKIERLVDNLDLQLLVFNRCVPKIVIKSNIFSNYLSSSSENLDSLVETELIRKSISPRHPKKHLQRRESSLKRYNQMKSMLIAALDSLAQKKTAERDKINRFKNESLAVRNKQKSQQLIEAACSEEGQISNSRLAVRQNGELDDLVSLTILRIGSKGVSNKDIEQVQRKESFRSEDGSSRDLQRKSTVKAFTNYSQNIYKKLYPHRELTLVSFLKDFYKIQINDRIWREPPLGKGQNKIRKELQTQFLKEKVNAFSHKVHDNKYKVVINLEADFKFLVLALSNIDAWKQWHPDIDTLQIISKLPNENSVQVYLECSRSPITFSCCLHVHLFKVDSRYFMVMKSIEPPEEKKQKKSFLNYLGFGWQNNRVYDYLNITVQTLGSKGAKSQIVIDFEVDHSQFKRSSKIRKQQLTFFINFFYIASFWAIKWEDNTENRHENEINYISQHSLFDPNWVVSSLDFTDRTHP